MHRPIISPATLARRIAAGTGDEPADLVITDARLYCLITGALIETDIAIVGDTVVGTHGRYQGQRTIDAKGRIAVPGFIDTHLHVESSLLTPFEYERCVLPHGVTTSICDPHEIANVLGAEGIRYFLEAATRLVMDLRVNLSSCVPATHLETAGAALSAADLVALRDHPKVIGLAEFMNFPGVVHRDPGCLDKLSAFSDGHIDGHAPLLRGCRSTATSPPASAPTTNDDRRGGAGEDRQGHAYPDPRGLGLQGPSCAAGNHRPR